MIRLIRDLRLVPIALIASACLLVLKTADIVLDGGSFLSRDNSPAEAEVSVIRTTPDMPAASGTKLSWAQEIFGFPDGKGTTQGPLVSPPPLAAVDPNTLDITGTIQTESAGKGDKKPEGAADPDAKADAAKAAAKEKELKPPLITTVNPLERSGLPSGAERAILERLQARRQELDTRARELDIREGLINAAEKRMEARLAEIKEVESKIAVETERKDEAQLARFKGLVTMYENMKPRDAAKIFDRLEMSVLLEVTTKINPRRMSDILALMSPETAERLTVELASRAREVKQNQLPKIEGRPMTP